MAIIETIITICLKLIGAWLDQVKADAETRETFLKFLDLAAEYQSSPAALKRSYDAQKQRLDELRKQLEAESAETTDKT